MHRGGRLVVDLWGGTADGHNPWRRDTIVHAYSVVKPVVAATAVALVGSGELALDGPVRAVWPELRAAEDGLTLRQVLTHAAGLVAHDEESTPLTDWDATCAALARQEPQWQPGTAFGEHALTYGHLVGELVRRVTGRRFGAVLQERIAGPLGMDLHVGLDANQRARAADLVEQEVGAAKLRRREATGLYRRALGLKPDALDPDVVNGEAWRSAEIPAVNGHLDARALARFYACLAGGGELDGIRVLDPGLVREVTRAQVSGIDGVLGSTTAWGLGPQIEDGQIGMGGLGGSAGWLDVERGLSIGYVTRTLGGFDRVDAIEAALVGCSA